MLPSFYMYRANVAIRKVLGVSHQAATAKHPGKSERASEPKLLSLRGANSVRCSKILASTEATLGLPFRNRLRIASFSNTIEEVI